MASEAPKCYQCQVKEWKQSTSSWSSLTKSKYKFEFSTCLPESSVYTLWFGGIDVCVCLSLLLSGWMLSLIKKLYLLNSVESVEWEKNKEFFAKIFNRVLQVKSYLKTPTVPE